MRRLKKNKQLRLSSKALTSEVISHEFTANDYTIHDEDSCCTHYDDWLGGDYMVGNIQISNKIEYDTISGLDDNKLDGCTIVVSAIVAEYLMKNKDKYWNLCNYVMVPDTNPRNVVRNDEGQIIGVKGLIYYSNLSNVKKRDLSD